MQQRFTYNIHPHWSWIKLLCSPILEMIYLKVTKRTIIVGTWLCLGPHLQVQLFNLMNYQHKCKQVVLCFFFNTTILMTNSLYRKILRLHIEMKTKTEYLKDAQWTISRCLCYVLQVKMLPAPGMGCRELTKRRESMWTCCTNGHTRVFLRAECRTTDNWWLIPGRWRQCLNYPFCFRCWEQ